MRRSLLLLPSCLVVALLAGCGNKGPLTLPPTRPAAASSTLPPVPPAPATSSALPVESQP